MISHFSVVAGLRWALPALMTVGLISCAKNSDNSSVVINAAPLSGTVQVFDDKTNVLADGSGVAVSLLEIPGLNAVTDAQGRYRFESVRFGTYTLVLSRNGYGTRRVPGIVHSSSSNGLTVAPNVSFGQVSTTSVTSLSVTSATTFNGAPGVTFGYNLTPVPTTNNRAFIRYFLGTTANVGPSNYTAFDSVRSFTNLSVITGFSRVKLNELGFTTGQQVFVRMFGDSFITNEYFDSAAGRRVFPNINPNAAPAVSITVP